MRLRAKILISTKAGKFPAGAIFEIDDRLAEKLIKNGYAEKAIENVNEIKINNVSEVEFDKLTKNELEKLAEKIGAEVKGKKDEIIEQIKEFLKNDEALKEEIFKMSLEELKELINE